MQPSYEASRAQKSLSSLARFSRIGLAAAAVAGAAPVATAVTFLATTAAAALLTTTAGVRAASNNVPVEQLMAPDALPDVVIGASDAPVTIVEYASMTCTHCATFHTTTYPELKRKFIDTGKVRFVLREFPLDPLAAAGFMAARCAGDDKRNAIVDFLFAQQKSWAFAEKPRVALADLLKQTGMSQSAFDACLSDSELYKKVLAVHDRAEKLFGIKATPTFFVNGRREDGEVSIETLDKLIEPLLKG
jgi:protein-disulfide isomerase